MNPIKKVFTLQGIVDKEAACKSAEITMLEEPNLMSPICVIAESIGQAAENANWFFPNLDKEGEPEALAENVDAEEEDKEGEPEALAKNADAQEEDKEGEPEALAKNIDAEEEDNSVTPEHSGVDESQVDPYADPVQSSSQVPSHTNDPVDSSEETEWSDAGDEASEVSENFIEGATDAKVTDDAKRGSSKKQVISSDFKPIEMQSKSKSLQDVNTYIISKKKKGVSFHNPFNFPPPPAPPQEMHMKS